MTLRTLGSVGSLVALLTLAATVSSCTDDTTGPTVTLGKISVDQFMSNTGYMSWFEVGYDAYPPANSQAEFDQAVDQIKTALSAGEASYHMHVVIKPNCGCQTSQSEMPKLMRTLDAAGFSQDDIDIWITDRQLNGLGDLEQMYDIKEAPTFLLEKDGAEHNRIEIDQSVSQGAELATSVAAMFSS